jgi:hypothetical protein
MEAAGFVQTSVSFHHTTRRHIPAHNILQHYGKIKESIGKVHRKTRHEGPEGEWVYSSPLSLTSALDGVSGQRHAPVALPRVKARYILYRRLGGRQGRSGRVRDMSPPLGFDPRTVQPVATCYTDWAIQAHILQHYGNLKQ